MLSTRAVKYPTSSYKHKPQHLQERVVMVTGAGQGLGRVAALSFSAEGATVILVGRKLEKLEKVYDEILMQNSPEPIIFVMDFDKAEEQEYANMAEAIYKQLGRLDGILHNATHFDNLSPLEIQTTKQLERMMRVNVSAPFAMTKACLPLLKESPDASVIFTSTSAANKPTAYWGTHAISKHAADYMMKIWASELEKFPYLRLNTVIPGAIQTPQRKKSHPGEVHDDLPETKSAMPIYHFLMGKDGKGISGKIFEAKSLKLAANQLEVKPSV
ncbi:MAG: SDR family NAD(P)-dependent oxidoreductase [Methylophilaceae bacterium]